MSLELATIDELTHMVDVSIGVETNVVDFNVLNSLLHIIVNRLCPCSKKQTFIRNDEAFIKKDEFRESSNSKNHLKHKSTTKDENYIETRSNLSETPSTEENLHGKAATLKPANEPDLAVVTKRLEATEIAINNLTLLMSELTQGYQNIEENVAPFLHDGQISGMKDHLDELQKELQDKGVITVKAKPIKTKGSTNKTSRTASVSSGNLLPIPTIHQTRDSLNMRRSKLQTIGKNYDEEINKLKVEMSEIRSIVGLNDFEEDLTASDGELKDLNLPVASSDPQMKKKPIDFVKRMSFMLQKIESLEKEVENCQKIPSTLLENNSSQLEESLINLDSIKEHGKLLTQNKEEIAVLNSQKEQLSSQIDKILLELNDLKADKVDKDDFEVILSEKADYNLMQKKVSIDQFNFSKRDLNKNFQDLLLHMSDKETRWENSIKEIKEALDTKLGNNDILTFKDFVNVKLGTLQNQLHTLAIINNDTDAAGTKIRLMKNLNCLSCDHKAVMKLCEPASYKLQKFPPSHSLKPYFTYELNKVRTCRDYPVTKNMNQLEMAIKQCGEVDNDTKLCLRFCGGDHTKITGEERNRALHN